MYEMGDRKNVKHFSVKWQGRILLPDRRLGNVSIIGAAREGLLIHYDRALAANDRVGVEFFVRYRGEMKRIRAKTEVVFSTILSENRGVKIGLHFIEISSDSMHALANVLHTIGSENEDDQ